MKRLNNKGFTIIELLIATVVFSVILLIITGAIVQIGRIYYKGVIQARTQERARAIVEDISQNLQFSGGSTPLGGNPAAYICAGNRVYTYKKNVQVSATQRALVAQSGVSCNAFSGAMNSGVSLPSLPSNATELVGDNMQLLDLSVVNPVGTDLYEVKVRLAYGSCDDMTSTCADPNRTCKAIILGGQFCAVSELTTTVSRRLK